MEGNEIKNELLHLLVDGKNAFPEIIDAIENAKTSIEINLKFFYTYIPLKQLILSSSFYKL